MTDINRYVREICSKQNDQFDTALLSNVTYETLQGATAWNELRRVVERKEDVYQLREETDIGALDDAAFDAGERLYEIEDWVVTVGVAEACRRVLEIGEDWQDTWDASTIEAAKEEARDWLRDHAEACEVVGGDELYKEVTDDE